MLWNVYLRKDVLYVPTVARTEAGFYLDVEPVGAAPIADIDLARKAVKQALERGNPSVPTPTRASFPKPIILRYANVRSWSVFQEKTTYWKIVESAGVYQIRRGRKRLDRGWEDDPESIESLAPGVSHEDVAERMCYLATAVR